MTKEVASLQVLKWLDKRDLSQKQWAERLGVHPMTVHFWVLGARPGLKSVDKIRREDPSCPLLRR